MKFDVKDMSAAADEASELLKSLANPHRMLILCQLLEGERSVGELASLLKTRDSVVSQHLALLRKDGHVTSRREGQTIHYSIASEPAKKIIYALAEIYCPQPLACADPARPAPARSPGQGE